MIKTENSLMLFNTIITTLDGSIIDFHFGQTDELEKSVCLQMKMKDLFDFWEEKESNMIIASKNTLQYLLLFKDFTIENQQRRMYILANGVQWFRLEERIKELDKSNRELDAIIESSFDGIYITDKFGNTLKTNSAIERITGIPKHYYIGKNINHLIKRGILEQSVTLKVMEQKRSVSVVQQNFNQKETLMTGNPIFNEEGEIEKIVTNIRDLSELNQLNKELKKVQQLNEKYKEELDRLKSFAIQDPDIILKSDKMIEIYQMIGRLANFDTTILVLGETGVGKDVLVRYLYRSSDRFKEGQLIKVNCGAIPNELLESELFGYEGGAFSGANRTGKVGMFELAHNGMLFLDEVGEMPMDLQVKLLRAIQEKEIMRVGGTKTKRVDVRLVAATNRDLKEMVKRGTFREDLYYRLNVVPIFVPPLRERRADILPLVHYFLELYKKKYSVEKVLDQKISNFFYQFDWPGNVRELSNLLERLILTVPNEYVTINDLPDEYQQTTTNEDFVFEEMSLREIVEQAEKTALKKALIKYKTTYQIAEKLQTSQATVFRKLQKYNLS
ncbi:sigma-54 interaction domain-containing protein [Metabacillus endolithicus]|uniref:HTH-type transcriptional regulatory protein TyrR n=1 Tax=Metabacillus endolithicus TaxID=1535204 RepID=A0ABW5BXY4_9BACI|nr:sigma 54-interacting transcriptional regulator [Metabacillus endolithicus]UPG64071.1 sigma 54-interacting transcriptional regulator [Metabacillus endolithicus]